MEGVTIVKCGSILPILHGVMNDFAKHRWIPENEAKLPRYAYLPFGAGPYICIGNHFAMMEAQLVLTTLVQR